MNSGDFVRKHCLKRLTQNCSRRPQAWKRQRLIELGWGIPDWLRLVPVNFEKSDSWWEQLLAAGFDPKKPAVAASSGVSMYLTRDAIAASTRHVAQITSSASLVMTFQLPLGLIEPEEHPGRESTEKLARMAGTPFICLFSPTEITRLAHDAGFREIEHISANELNQRYFAGRTDHLHPSRAEELLLAVT